MNLRELAWPMLERLSAIEAGQAAAQLQQDLQAIKDARVDLDPETLVEEARRLIDAEEDRRKTADTKARTYLTVNGVLAPILATLTPAIWDSKESLLYRLITLLFFAAAGAYLLAGGLWAFKTLRVSASSQLDARELVAIWRTDAPKVGVAKGLLECVRRNRDGVNEKVTCIKMAHEFGIRAFAAFTFVLFMRAGWLPLGALVKLLLS